MNMASWSYELFDKAQNAEGCEREKEEGIPFTYPIIAFFFADLTSLKVAGRIVAFWT